MKSEFFHVEHFLIDYKQFVKHSCRTFSKTKISKQNFDISIFRKSKSYQNGQDSNNMDEQ